jgi:hypothetical protein
MISQFLRDRPDNRRRNSPCPTTTTTSSGRALSHREKSVTRRANRWSGSTATPRSSSGPLCHQGSLRWSKVNIGNSADSADGDLPISQLFSSRSLCRSVTIIGTSASPKSPTAVWIARVRGDTTTKSAGISKAACRAAATCSMPIWDRRASKCKGSTRFKSKRALNVDCPCLIKWMYSGIASASPDGPRR